MSELETNLGLRGYDTITVDFNPDTASDEICFDMATMSDPTGNAIAFDLGDCYGGGDDYVAQSPSLPSSRRFVSNHKFLKLITPVSPELSIPILQ